MGCLADYTTINPAGTLGRSSRAWCVTVNCLDGAASAPRAEPKTWTTAETRRVPHPDGVPSAQSVDFDLTGSDVQFYVARRAIYTFGID
jgi:hypothetical protein